jgi:mannose-6-phosphate isomerase-like protein (cupin superfamily)
MRWSILMVLLIFPGGGTVGCGPGPAPRLLWEGSGPPRAEEAGAAVLRLPETAPGVRSGPWGESADATFQLLGVEAGEQPHVHQHHDLTVVLLRGRGVLVVEGRRQPLRAGDVVHIGRGRVHHFHPDWRTSAVGLGIYTPKLVGKDYLPAPEDAAAPAGASASEVDSGRAGR